MALTWSLRRKLLYSGTTIFVALLIVVFIWFKYFNVPPTCFDGRQNGNEIGVDCGGSCALLCVSQTSDPTVLWARAFPNGANTYTAAAYIHNPNAAGAHDVGYAFQFFDADNKLVQEKDGVMDIPPQQTVPVVEPMIYAGNRTIVRTLFSFANTPVWKRVPKGTIPELRVKSQTLSSDTKRLDATIANSSLVQNAPEVTVIAVLFDSQGIARAASKSLVPVVPSNSSEQVVFTWPQSTDNIARTEVTILPSF